MVRFEFVVRAKYMNTQRRAGTKVEELDLCDRQLDEHTADATRYRAWRFHHG